MHQDIKGKSGKSDYDVYNMSTKYFNFKNVLFWIVIHCYFSDCFIWTKLKPKSIQSHDIVYFKKFIFNTLLNQRHSRIAKSVPPNFSPLPGFF